MADFQEVFGARHRDNPRQGGRFGGRNRANAGVSVRASHDAEIKHPGPGEIVQIPAAAGQQRQVFLAADGLADQLNGTSSRSHKSGIISRMPRKCPSSARR